jgi:hypothetical protein
MSSEIKSVLAGSLLLLSLVSIALSTVTLAFHAGQLSTPFVALISLFSSTISSNSGWRSVWQFLAYFSIMLQSMALALSFLALSTSTAWGILNFILVAVQMVLIMLLFVWGLDTSTDKTSEPWSDHLRSFLTSGRVSAYRIILLVTVVIGSLVAFGLAIAVIVEGSHWPHVIFALTSMGGIPLALLTAAMGFWALGAGRSAEWLEWAQLVDIILLAFSSGLIGYSGINGVSTWVGGNPDLNYTCIIFLVFVTVAQLLLGCLSQMTGMSNTSYETLPN